MYFTSYKQDFTHPLSSAFISNFPRTAAPLSTVIATGTIKQYSKNLYREIYCQGQQQQIVTNTTSETNHFNPYNYYWHWVQLWAKLIAQGCPQWHCHSWCLAELGRQGGASGKSLCIQVSMTRVKYCLLSDVCMNWRKSKSSAKTPRPANPVGKWGVCLAWLQGVNKQH